MGYGPGVHSDDKDHRLGLRAARETNDDLLLRYGRMIAVSGVIERVVEHIESRYSTQDQAVVARL